MFRDFDEKEWRGRYDSVYGYFYRRVSTKSDVEDLTMETLETFYLSQKKIENPNAFLWGVARNKMLEYIRNKSKTRVFELNEQALKVAQSDSENNYSAMYLEKLERLKECTKSQLSDLDQEIVELCILQDFKSAEVSQKLGITAQNARQRLSRALKKLREKCKEIWAENT